MNVTIYPSKLKGTVSAPPSKSQAHRLLICAALSKEPTVIYCDGLSEDITATVDCLIALGGKITYADGKFSVEPIKTPVKNSILNCNESGSTLRFLIPVVAALGSDSTFKMAGRLSERPLSPLKEELEKKGIVFSRPTPDTLKISGKISGGDYTVDGSVSSQFISGLLFALPLFKETSSLTVTGNLQSTDYVNMTTNALEKFGVKVSSENGKYTINGSYSAKKEYFVEGDWSNGAFWLCGQKLLNDSISCDNLNPDSLQGDKEIVKLIRDFGKDCVTIDAGDIPDLVPILSVTALSLNNKTIIKNAQRLKIKESDRLFTTVKLISDLGGIAEETEDGLIITGTKRLKGGTINSFNDHRIAMSGAIASLICDRPVTIINADAVKKSYPKFWNDFKKLGGKIHIEEEM